MSKLLIKYCVSFTLLTWFASAQLFAQPEYYMSNDTVFDCEGIFFDSDEGLISDHYAHNENLTFTICIDGALEITLIFFEFCTETGFDFISFYNGPDTLSPQIGPAYSGIALPPPIVATSGCLTIHFISDASVSCTGWSAFWSVDMEIPEAAEILEPATVDCESTGMTITFDEPVPCDELIPGNFNLFGPLDLTVTQVTPINCIDGFTTSASLLFDNLIDVGGYYDLVFEYEITDACDSVWSLVSDINFGVLNCPIEVELFADPNPICNGDCATLTAIATGGNPANYVYNWSPAVTGNGDEVTVCPTSTTTYTVTVSDGGVAVPGTATITVIVQNPPLILSTAISICRTADPITLNATPAGGTWSGPGITNQTAGIFNPTTAGAGPATITYSDGLCTDDVIINVLPINAGSNNAACYDTNNFFVTGGNPAGGIWSGSNIAPNGLFTVTGVGSFDVTYTAPNGCEDSKVVIVDTLVIALPDSICTSMTPFTLQGSPPGGTWTSTAAGISNASTGAFDPTQAPEGMQTITYTLTDGCAESSDIYVSQISAGNDLSACPTQAPFILPDNPQPAGGLWSGAGIVNPMTGLYSPMGLSHGFNDTVFYTVDGCAAFRVVRIRNTNVNPPQSYEFCLGDDHLLLDADNTGRTPGGGTWSGPGVYNPMGNQWFFNPMAAGPGTHLLTYTVNTCSAGFSVTVHPNPVTENLTTCVQAPNVTINVTPAGGTFSGPGIVNTTVGVFSPVQAGPGTHIYQYTSPQGCSSSGTIVVQPSANPTITLPSPMCYNDTLYIPLTNPAGGTLSGPGVVGNGFNPVLAGQGIHMLTYTIGNGVCATSQNIPVNVYPPLEIFVPEFDIVCSGDLVYITVDSFSGGPPQTGSPDFFWNQGLGFGQTHLVYLDNTTTYTVTASDYCSDPVSATVTIPVNPAINVNFSTGPEVCYGEETYATAIVSPGGNYTYAWSYGSQGPPATVFGSPGTYSVTVTDTLSGCSSSNTVQLPGSQIIKAEFSANPKPEVCVSLLRPQVSFLDQSIGASSGFWYINGEVKRPYQYGTPLNHTFTEPGNYEITLMVRNFGFCTDTLSMNICVVAESRIYLPNAFTPNYDGQNDYLEIKAAGVDQVIVRIYDRWGKQMFESESLEISWDGTYLGKQVPLGIYTVHVAYRAPDVNGWGHIKGNVLLLY